MHQCLLRPASLSFQPSHQESPNATDATGRQDEQNQRATNISVMNELSLSSLTSLLARIDAMLAKDQEHKNRYGLDFNVFRLCGVDHYETKHSSILAALLDPKGTHGLGTAFLQSFLDKIPASEAIGRERLIASTDSRVQTEVPVDSDNENLGRVDILINDVANQWSIVIENKIFASEGANQIARYRRWLDTKQTNFTRYILFLTLDGHAPGTDNHQPLPESKVSVLRMSWKHDILSWLSECVRLAVERPFVRETLRQYINLVKQLTEGLTMSEELNREIVSLATKDYETFRGVVQLMRQKSAIFNTLADRVATKLKTHLGETNNAFWTWETRSSSDPFSKSDEFIFLRHVSSKLIVRIAPESIQEIKKVYVGMKREDCLMDDSQVMRIREGLIHEYGWEWKGNTDWVCWKYLPNDCSWWNGDFFLDWLAGDRRNVLSTIENTLDEINTTIASMNTAGQVVSI